MPGQFSAVINTTTLTNPDFVALADAYCAYGVRVERFEEFPAAFKSASASGKAAIIHLILYPDALSPNATISGLRSQSSEG